MFISSRNKQQGAVLIIVLLLLAIMMVLAISLSSNSSSHAKIVNNNLLRAQAFQMAESGADAVLSYLMENPDNFEDLKGNTCDKPFANQFKASMGGNTVSNLIETGSSSDSRVKRNLKLYWYACYPKDQKMLDCGYNTQCFALIVSGIACPSSTKIDGNGNPKITNACVVTRHLQGYQIR